MSHAAFDYVIVGGGAAGCVVAARLCEDPRNRVALVEAGGADTHPLIHIPGASVFAMSRQSLNWGFASQPIAALDGRTLPHSQGRALGGSGSINGMIFLRGHPADYDEWAAQGCAGWSAADLAPCFARARERLRVSPARSSLAISDLFLAAAREAGYPIADDLDGAAPESFGRYAVNVANGRRISAARAYLNPRPANLEILTGALVDRIAIEKGRAVGVEILRDGARVRLTARREIVLSAGALNTPQILMRSGVGPAAELARHGIALAADNPAIGANLQNHPVYRLHYAVKPPITAYRHIGPLRGPMAALAYLFGRTGVLAEPPFPVGGFMRSDPALDRADIQIIVAAGIAMRNGTGWRSFLPKRHGFTIFVNLGRPHSRGTVRLTGADPRLPPAIEPRYFADPRDMHAMAAGIRAVQRIAARPALAGVIENPIAGPGESDEALIADIRATAGCYFHYAGSCALGPDARSALDLRLRVRGVGGLRVADASAIPILPNANTHAPALAIAEKAAELIRADA